MPVGQSTGFWRPHARDVVVDSKLEGRRRNAEKKLWKKIKFERTRGDAAKTSISRE
jgi:hypothetical protein